ASPAPALGASASGPPAAGTRHSARAVVRSAPVRGAGSGRRGRGAARARPARVTRRGGGDTTTPAASGRCRGRRASRSRGRSEERPERSDAADVRGLQTLGALLDVELHALVLLEVATAAADDGAEVSEHISGAVLGGDEAVALVGVEPGDDASSHGDISFVVVSHGRDP